MKKAFALLIALVMTFLLVSCGGDDPLQTIEGISSSQLSAVKAVLDECGIVVESCKKANVEAPDESNELQQNLTDQLAQLYQPYTIIASDGKEYRMVLDTDTFEVISITNDAKEVIYGGLSNLFNLGEDDMSSASDPESDSYSSSEPQEDGRLALKEIVPTFCIDFLAP